MTVLAISRTLYLLRLNPIPDYGTVVLRDFQTFAKLCSNYRRPKVDPDVEIIDDGLPKDYRLQVFKLNSRRLDAVVSKTIGQGRGQAEKLILTGKVQINEGNIPKKPAYFVEENDIIDIWKQPVEGNIKYAEVHRIEIISYALTEQGYDINLKSWKNFYAQNWRDKS